MRVSLALSLCLAACRSAPLPPSAVAAPCTTDRVGAVTVSGAPRSAVPALVVLEGTLDDPARTRRLAEAATRELRWRGYARATLAITRVARCFTELRVAVKLGPRYRIARIDFETTDDFPRAERLAAIEDALGTVNTIGGVLIEYRLRRALALLERRYHDAGWLDAEIGEPAARYGPGTVALTIRVRAGARYRVGTIRAVGGSARARARLLVELGLTPGAWYDGPSIRRALARARRSIDPRVELRTNQLAERPEIELEAILEARP